jgi:hypothetical protein
MTKDQRSVYIRIALISYCPLSSLLVGLLSQYIVRIGPSYVVVLFQGGLLRNTIPFPGYPGLIQLPGLVLGFCSFALATFFLSSSRPLIGLFHVRVLLILLIWLVTFPINAVVISESRGAGTEAWMRLIFVAVHLIIAFSATFLPFLESGKLTIGWTETRSIRRAGFRAH